MGTDSDIKTAACPICGKPRAEKYRPFCSHRCADIDLHRWLTGVYAVPAVEDDDAPDDVGGEPSPGRLQG